MKAESIHAICDGAGVHIPRVFCEKYQLCISCDDKHKERMKEAVETCLTEEECDDAWDFIIENAVIIDKTYHAMYRIHQDGDVWLIPCQKEVKWVPDADCEVDAETLEEDYCASLDDIYGHVKVGNSVFDASKVLKAMDKVVFDAGYGEWLGHELTDKQIVAIDGKYYRVSAKEPDDYTDYWFEEDEHEGHYEWKNLPKVEVVKDVMNDVPPDFFDDKFEELLDSR